MKKFHRDAPQDIPADPKERQKMVRWVMDHPLWRHPVAKWDKAPGELSGGGFYETVDFEFVYVDPVAERIQTEDSDNPDPRDTAFRVWVEAGGWSDQSLEPYAVEPEGGWDALQNDEHRWMPVHDLLLDCGAPDMESALLELALRVKFFYNDDGSDKKEAPQRCELHKAEEEYVRDCEADTDGYCHVCGFPVEED